MSLSRPSDGQEIGWVKLVTGELININHPRIGRWERDKVVVRHTDGTVLQEFPRDQIADLGQRKTRVFLTTALVILSAAIVLLIVGGGSVDPYGD